MWHNAKNCETEVTSYYYPVINLASHIDWPTNHCYSFHITQAFMQQSPISYILSEIQTNSHIYDFRWEEG